MTHEPNIKGLTLRHPWSWAFQHGKDTENRSWHPSRQGGEVGMYLALHGGVVPLSLAAYWDEIHDAVAWMSQQNLPCAEKASDLLNEARELCVPGIVAVGKLVEVRRDSPSQWAVKGQVHWCLEVTPLPRPVLHKGAQGLWTLEPEALVQVREQFKQATKGRAT